MFMRNHRRVGAAPWFRSTRKKLTQNQLLELFEDTVAGMDMARKALSTLMKDSAFSTKIKEEFHSMEQELTMYRNDLVGFAGQTELDIQTGRPSSWKNVDYGDNE